MAEKITLEDLKEIAETLDFLEEEDKFGALMKVLDVLIAN